MRWKPFLTFLATVLFAASSLAGAGDKMYREFVENNELYPDPRLKQYIRDIGNRLLAQTPDAGKTYRFNVLDSAQVNAFATQGAYIYVSRGLIAYLGSEDELAAVIGHEIAHVTARHLRKRGITDKTGKALGMVAYILSQRPEFVTDVFSPLTEYMISGYGREMELEADRLGAEYMARAGYNPEAIIDSVWVLKDQQTFAKQVTNAPATYHGLSRTHPRNDRRLHEAVSHGRSIATGERAEPVGDFWAMIDGLTFGDETSSGLVKDNTFYHGGLRTVVTFPEDWSVVAPSTQAVATAPGGEDEAAIVFSRQDPVRRKSPAKYVKDVLKRDDVIGEEVEIAGKEAYVGEIDPGELDRQLRLLAVIYGGRSVYVFRGECGPDGDPETFREQFMATINGVRPMTAEDLATANNRRIDIVVAEPHMNYAQLATSAALRENPVETLRLINADYPNGEPTAGDYIKVVR